MLGLLFGNPRRSFHANEVIGLARSGTGAVQRELVRLEGAGLVTVTRVGKQKHYQANAASPVFEELRALVLKTSGLADVGRRPLSTRLTLTIAARHHGSLTTRIHHMHNPEAMGNVDFTLKADEELLGLGLALNHDDACDVLAGLSMRDFAERTTSTLTGEFMYVFTPQVASVSLYVKVILRRRCVLVSFHEQEDSSDCDEI